MEFRTVTNRIELKSDELVRLENGFVEVFRYNFNVGDTITNGEVIITISQITDNVIHTDYVYYINSANLNIGSTCIRITGSNWKPVTTLTDKIRRALMKYKYIVDKASGKLVSLMTEPTIMSRTDLTNVPNGKILAVMNNGTREILTYDSDEEMFYFDDGSIVDEDHIKYWYELAHQ